MHDALTTPFLHSCKPHNALQHLVLQSSHCKARCEKCQAPHPGKAVGSVLCLVIVKLISTVLKPCFVNIFHVDHTHLQYTCQSQLDSGDEKRLRHRGRREGAIYLNALLRKVQPRATRL